MRFIHWFDVLPERGFFVKPRVDSKGWYPLQFIRFYSEYYRRALVSFHLRGSLQGLFLLGM